MEIKMEIENIAVISDLHIGDPACKIIKVKKTSRNKKKIASEDFETTPTFDRLVELIMKKTGNRSLDILVLNGDNIDFSISSFEKSLIAAKPFFNSLSEQKIAKNIFYIPGNHDKQIWDAVEWETNIIARLKKREEPRPFRRTQPALINLPASTIELPGVSLVEDTTRFGKLFIEGLFDSEENTIPIYIAYPNLYIKTFAETFMVTHGHMFELPWLLLSELLSGILECEKVEHFEELNFPLTSMICTGIGQGGRVSELLYEIQSEAKSGKSKALSLALDSIIPRLELLIDLGFWDHLDESLLYFFSRKAISIAENDIVDPRGNKEFLNTVDTRKRFSRFLTAACFEVKNLWSLTPPTKLFYGHTHESSAYDNPNTDMPHPLLPNTKMHLYNTGGWLEGGKGGAEVFFIDASGNIDSVNIQ